MDNLTQPLSMFGRQFGADGGNTHLKLSELQRMGGDRATKRKRASSYRKRRDGMKKKTHELAILCDVDACVVLIGPEGDFDSWPEESSNVRAIVEKYYLKIVNKKLKEINGALKQSKSYRGNQGTVKINTPTNGQIVTDPKVELPLAREFNNENLAFHHSICSYSPSISESGSDILSKREELKSRDTMIMDLLESEREIQRLRYAIADHCVGQIGHNEKGFIYDRSCIRMYPHKYS